MNSPSKTKLDARQGLIGGQLQGKEDSQPDTIRAKCAYHVSESQSSGNCTYRIAIKDGFSYVINAICHSRGCNSEDVLKALGRFGIATRLDMKASGTKASGPLTETGRWTYKTVSGENRVSARKEDAKGNKRVFQSGATNSAAYVKPWYPKEEEHRVNELLDLVFDSRLEPDDLNDLGRVSEEELKKFREPPPVRPLVIVEGEPCAEYLAKLGYLAVTWVGGVQIVDKAEWSPISALARRYSIILWPDDDDAGRKAMSWVQTELDKRSIPHRVVQNSGHTKKDCVDFPEEEVLKILMSAEKLKLKGKKDQASKANPMTDNPALDLAEFCLSTDNFCFISYIPHHFNNKSMLWYLAPDTDTLSQVCLQPQYLHLSGIEMERGFNFQVGRVLRALMLARPDKYPKTRSINFNIWPMKSRVFDSSTGETRPYDREDYFTQRLDYEIAPGYKTVDRDVDDIEIPVTLFRVLNEGLWKNWEEVDVDYRESYVDAVLECLAYIIFCPNVSQKFFVFWGSSGSGKGLIDRLIEGILGKEGCKSLDERLIKDGKEWAFVGLEQKRYATLKDISGGIVAAPVKSLVGEDILTAAYKGESAYEFMYEGHFAIFSNHRLNVDDPGIARRLVVIGFEGEKGKHDETRDVGLNEKLRNERGITLRYLYEFFGKTLIRNMQSGKGGFKMPDILKEEVKEFTESDISVSSFFRDRIIIDHEGEVTKMSELAEAYIKSCGLEDVPDIRKAKNRFRRFVSDNSKAIGLRSSSIKGYWYCTIRPIPPETDNNSGEGAPF